jgi:hypothetical protein
MLTIRSFSHLNSICKKAAEKAYYPEVIKELHRQVPRDWREIAEATVIFSLPAAILDLPTKAERRRALDSIPSDTKITNLRQFMEDGITFLWERDRELDKRPRKRR